MMYQPHYWRRHVIGPIGIREVGGVIGVDANYAVFRTMPDKLPEVFHLGRCLEKITHEDGCPKFRGKLCVFDPLRTKNSLVSPV